MSAKITILFPDTINDTAISDNLRISTTTSYAHSPTFYLPTPVTDPVIPGVECVFNFQRVSSRHRPYKEIFKFPGLFSRSSKSKGRAADLAIGISQIRRLRWNRSRGNTRSCARIHSHNARVSRTRASFRGAFRIENLSG